MTKAARAKLFASETAVKVVDSALQMFGARGYGDQTPLERMYRDVRMFTIGGGTAQILRTQIAGKVLGIKTSLLNQEWKVYLDTQSNLDYDVSRSAWIGDYADPNTFLDMFVTDGENNKTGWSNAEYDRLIAEAARELDPAQRMQLLQDAEALLVDELPILPIYFYVTQNVVDPRVGGFFENIQDEHFPKFWYWMDDEELRTRCESEGWDYSEVLGISHGPSGGLYSAAQELERSAR